MEKFRELPPGGRAGDSIAWRFRDAPTEVSDDIRRLSTQHLTDSGDTVLGHAGYVDKAKAKGASYFEIDTKVWDSLNEAQQKAANRYFLDTIADRGDRILLSVEKSKIRKDSWLKREVDYLTQERGYVWVNQWTLRPKE